MNKFLDDYYSLYCNEDERLVKNAGKIEYLTTLKYILEYLKPKTQMVELGAGTGRYSLELAKSEFDVTAVELVDHNVNILKEKAKDFKNIKVLKGNALDLSCFSNDSFDACLIFGPMYHLYNEPDKLKVLAEAKRITKNNGIIFVTYCMNEATIIQWGFKRGSENIKDAIKKNMLTNDFHCISKEEDIFELVRMEDIDKLNKKADLERIKIIGTDMFSGYLKEEIENMDEETFNIFTKYHLSICERKDIIGISNHTLDILKNKK